ncbi:DUF4012 domain-containing protein [Gordonia aquimaris]|uniref:DUF4012 domain-containing protein n=1 Tax=Gordonia aquimaris TaxID=2984863 RepID=A0A9X3I5L2_9ACTN|nr:DUF4012 domain-containing protein [Gordonia aquimaris]MCX2965381.1 DUF4012 domain-containing protein [Gordonia aquimaris]
MIRRMLGNRVVQICLVLGVLLVAVLLWLGFSALKVRGDLDGARDDASKARSLALDGDQEAAGQAADAAADKAQSASDWSHGIVWSAAASIPWLGDPLESVAQMSDAVEALATDVLVPSAQLASVLNPAELRDGSTLDTAPLAEAEPQLAQVAATSSEIAAQVEAIDPSWLGVVSDAHTQLREQVDEAAATMTGTHVAAQLVPTMLGGDGPRNYFLAFQTPSEARGTGGLVGGFAILNARDGRVTIPTLGANSTFEDPVRPQIDLGPDYDAIYSSYRPYTDFRNNNLSANFPDAAKIWIANWKRQSGQQLDGAMALDPIALSYVLKVTGPVTLPDGEKITADNVVPITLSTSYERFRGDSAERKLYLQSIAKAVVDQAVSSGGDTGALLEALGHGVQERRIMIYSTRPDEERILQSTELGHQISDTSAPYLQVAIGNAGGNKLDYYLRRDISYTAGECSGDTRESKVVVKLTNTLDDLTLSDYVIAPNGTVRNLPKGTNLSNVEMLTTKGSVVKEITVDGSSPMRVEQPLNGRPYVATAVQIPPGETVTIEMTLDEPTMARGEAVVPIQPLVDEPTVHVDVPVCGGSSSE